MKKLLVLAAFIPSCLFAQSVTLSKIDILSPNAVKNPANVCYVPEAYEQISNELFKAGNPKYVWVDLLKDGLVADGDATAYHLYINTTKKGDKGTVTIPDALQAQYLEKWTKFVASLGEKTRQNWSYSLNVWNGVSAREIINKTSDICKTSKADLQRLSLTARGEIRFYEELIKDGLASPDKVLNYELSPTGFVICGKKLNAEQREKYAQLLKEEFDVTFSGKLYSRWLHGPLAENILSKELTTLHSRLVTAE